MRRQATIDAAIAPVDRTIHASRFNSGPRRRDISLSLPTIAGVKTDADDARQLP